MLLKNLIIAFDRCIVFPVLSEFCEGERRPERHSKVTAHRKLCLCFCLSARLHCSIFKTIYRKKMNSFQKIYGQSTCGVCSKARTRKSTSIKYRCKTWVILKHPFGSHILPRVSSTGNLTFDCVLFSLSRISFQAVVTD